ncbi:MAG: DNA-3-methyladenine glycosylase I [Halanaerobiales bacterium]|nr:DNA-3-methyladenine glycosylase I [Halanaerobiales bacterium]
MQRCSWSESEEIYIKYHDQEWGVPILDDNLLFEYLTLETAQAGLSWLTILKRREGYREAYDNFDIYKVAQFNENKKKELINNKKIIRNKLKIEASINNAKQSIKVIKKYGSLSNYFWSFTDYRPIVNQWESIKKVPAESTLSKKIAKDLKKRDFKFVGSLTIYAFMQAVGIVNDHIKECFRYQEIIELYPKIFKS